MYVYRYIVYVYYMTICTLYYVYCTILYEKCGIHKHNAFIRKNSAIVGIDTESAMEIFIGRCALRCAWSTFRSLGTLHHKMCI